MGKIKKILENELIGGTQSTDVYPVTSTKAVYNEDNENLDSILNTKVNTSDIVQQTGDSTTSVMSQKAVSDKLNDLSDNVSIKDEEGTVVTTPFSYIQNEEFIFAKVDANDKLLFGIQWDGTPVFSKTSAVEDRLQSQVTLLAEKVATIMGDDDTTSAIDTLKELKNFFASIDNTQNLTSILASLQEKVGTIDTDLKELLDVFSLQENPEYMAVEKDADGKILSATYNDGSHYIHNAKSETIPEEFEHIEDPEGRTEITTDTDSKVLGYRDLEGTRHEYKISAKHLELSDEAANEVNNAFKSAGIKMENPSDFSKDSYVELPIPRIAAQVRIYASKLPTTKQDDIEAEIEYNDKDGNYFRKPVILNSQGSSSMSYIDKKTGERGNIAIDINDGSKIKFGDFPSQDSFHLKKYFIDIFRGQCIVGYWLMEQVYQTRTAGKRYPYELLSDVYSPYTGNGKVNRDFYTGAKCHPDGFPIVITWVNTITNEEKNIGVYAWNLKKSKEVYHADKKTPENIILDGVIDSNTLFGGTIDWTQFEIRNPKSLIDIDGNKYDGDNPKELSETDKNSKKVKDYLVRLSGVKAALTENNTKETFEKYFIAESFIDYFVISQVLYHLDGFRKNWIWCTWDGQHWAPTLYDVDSILGAHWNGTFVIPNSDNNTILGTGSVLGLETLYADEIKARYKQLRDSNIFSVDNIINLLEKWLNNIGYENIEDEIKLYPDTPSYRNPNLNSGWAIVGYASTEDNYNAEKTYNEGDTCIYMGYTFKAATTLTNVPPLSSAYSNKPYYFGFYNSVKRVSVWLTNRLAFLDKTYSYTEV